MLAPLSTLEPFLMILVVVIIVFGVDFLNQIVPFLFELHTGVSIIIHIGVPLEALSDKLLQTFLDLVHKRLDNLLILALIQNPLQYIKPIIILN